MVSDALDPKPSIFSWTNPKRIAASLKHSALIQSKPTSEPFQSAMSMLNFQINRTGRNLPANRKRVLEQTRFELRKLFNK